MIPEELAASLFRAVLRGKRAARWAADGGDPSELYRIFAAGYSAAIFVLREPKLIRFARMLKAWLRNGDTIGRVERSH